MGKIKILVLGADDKPGGVCTYANELVNLCDKDKFEFHIAVSEIKQHNSVIHKDVIRHALPVTYSALSLGGQIIQIRNIIKNNGINILHLHTARAGFIGALASTGLKLGLLYTGHGWRFDQKVGRASRALFFLYEKFICSIVDKVSFSTPFDKNFGVNRGLLSENKSVVIRTRMNADEYRSVDAGFVKNLKQQLGIRPNSKVIGSVGYMNERKDPMTFLQVAAIVLKKNANAHFLWVGDGELKEQFLNKAKDLGIDSYITATGFIPTQQLPPYLHVMDVFLFTSHYEGVPLSVLAAQSVNLPVVCSNYIGSGVDELVLDGITGYVFEPSDSEKAAELVINVLENSSETNFMVKNMHERFEAIHNNPAAMGTEFNNLYNSLIYKSV